MNAIAPCLADEATERTARHMRILAELADLGLQMARVAAAKYQATQAAQESPQAEPKADAESPGESLPAPLARKQADPGHLFTRLGRLVRDCVTMEARLAAGLLPTRYVPVENTTKVENLTKTDPRRAPLQNAFRIAAENNKDSAEILRHSIEHLDEALAADPNSTFSVVELFVAICDEIGVEVDPEALRQICRSQAIQTPTFQIPANQVKTSVTACAAYPP